MMEPFAFITQNDEQKKGIQGDHKQVYIIKVAKLSPSSQVASKIKREPLENDKIDICL